MSNHLESQFRELIRKQNKKKRQLIVQKAWQLLEYPKDFKSFENQPILTPQFFAEKFTIISPTDYQTHVQNMALIEIGSSSNSQRRVEAVFAKRSQSEFLLWNFPSTNPFIQEKKSEITICKSQNHRGKKTQIYCQFSEPGDYQVLLLSLDLRNHSLRPKVNLIGQLKFRSLEAEN